MGTSFSSSNAGENGSGPQSPDLSGTIEFFDRLIEEGAGVPALVSQAARRAQCIVGLRTSGGDVDVAAGADGRLTLARPVGPDLLIRPVGRDSEVWLFRSGPDVADDESLLQRMAVAASVSLRYKWFGAYGQADPGAMVETLVSRSADDTDRLRALRLLGYSATTVVRSLAVDAPEAGAQSILRQLDNNEGRVYSVDLGSVHAMITAGPIPEDLAVPTGARVAVGPAVPGHETPRSWRAALSALRFALPSQHDAAPYPDEEAVVVQADRIGGFALLADYVPAEAIAELAGVRALDRLVSEFSGDEMLRTLEVVAGTESLRRAASTLHMHHNSVRHRVSRAEQLLGFSITAPRGRVQLFLLLVLRRLRDSSVRNAPFQRTSAAQDQPDSFSP
ncbi:MAG: hypothetical protein C0482_23520 [Gordonia sp.]|nr:hypothetical protein [Gordonia sp. (in: high G+C Gram-positive bacteria)]